MENEFHINKDRIYEYIKGQHFMHLIGFSINKIEEGIIEGELDLKKIHKQQKGFAHGGLIATLADIVCGFAAYTVVHPQNHVVTAELKISYLNPGVGERLLAYGWVLKKGKKLNFCESEIYAVSGDKKILIAKASSTMANIFTDDYQ
jgi:uncharacterized protein (TIGR00369 family)